MMKVQVADSWQTQLRRRFQCNLQSMATCTQQLHLYCRLLQEIDYCLFLTDDPGDFTDKEIYIVDCHDVTLLLKSEAGFKLRFIRSWLILWCSRHHLGQTPLPLADISAGSHHGREEVEVLEVARLQTAQSFSLLTINTADKKAALSWLDLAWEFAGRMQSLIQSLGSLIFQEKQLH